MTVITPEPPDDEVVQRAHNIIEAEANTVKVEIFFAMLARLSVMMVVWRKTMLDGGFSPEWVESAATDIFSTFVPPFVEPTQEEVTFVHHHE